jgi:thiosulfate dehydrogenase [quinone] large subunit
VIIIAAGYNAGRIGLDRWVIPFLRKITAKDNNSTVKLNA